MGGKEGRQLNGLGLANCSWFREFGIATCHGQPSTWRIVMVPADSVQGEPGLLTKRRPFRNRLPFVLAARLPPPATADRAIARWCAAPNQAPPGKRLSGKAA